MPKKTGIKNIKTHKLTVEAYYGLEEDGTKPFLTLTRINRSVWKNIQRLREKTYHSLLYVKTSELYGEMQLAGSAPEESSQHLQKQLADLKAEKKPDKEAIKKVEKELDLIDHKWGLASAQAAQSFSEAEIKEAIGYEERIEEMLLSHGVLEDKHTFYDQDGDLFSLTPDILQALGDDIYFLVNGTVIKKFDCDGFTREKDCPFCLPEPLITEELETCIKVESKTKTDKFLDWLISKILLYNEGFDLGENAARK